MTQYQPEYLSLAYGHLMTVIPAFMIASYMLLTKKGTRSHRLLGKIYMVLMLVTATITLFMSAAFGPTLFGHFGVIHLFSLLVFYTVPLAYLAIKKGNIKRHKAAMKGLYIGGLLIAGAFTLTPGRLLNHWLFG